MRRSIVAILAVAIIGALGIYNTSHKTNANTAVQSANTTADSSVASSNTNSSAGGTSTTYKDGTYTGASEDTPYGTVQVAVVVSGGKITDVNFLQMPNDLGHSQEVTSFSEPLLKDSTLSKQTSHINFVSGATSTSEGYEQSLQAALDQAV